MCFFFAVPFNCIIEGLHNPHLSIDARLYLFELAFDFIMHYLYNPKDNPISITTRIGLIRILNTIIGLAASLTRFNLVKLGHISTHPLENFFGTVRFSSKNNHSCENIIDSIAKGILFKKIFRRYKLSETIRTRVGIGGETAIITKTDAKVPSYNPFHLFKEVWSSLKTGSIPEMFYSWYISFKDIEWKDKFYTPSTISGSNILARYIADITDSDKKKKEEKEEIPVYKIEQRAF